MDCGCEKGAYTFFKLSSLVAVMTLRPMVVLSPFPGNPLYLLSGVEAAAVARMVGLFPMHWCNDHITFGFSGGGE